MWMLGPDTVCQIVVRLENRRFHSLFFFVNSYWLHFGSLCFGINNEADGLPMVVAILGNSWGLSMTTTFFLLAICLADTGR